MFVGPVHALAALLAVAAVAKLRNPSSAAVALGRAGLPSTFALVRILALAELLVAAAVLLFGGVLAVVALGLLHLGFAAFIVRLLRAAGAKASCGCFGGAEAPAGRLHVVVNTAAAAVAAVSLGGSLPSLPAVLGDRLSLALPYGAAVAVGAWATGLCLTSLPALVSAQRQVAT